MLGGIIVHAVTKEGTRKLEFHECLRPAKKRAVRGIAALEVKHHRQRCRFALKGQASLFQKRGLPKTKKRAAKEENDSPRRWFVYSRSPGW